jgi:hypothetical protein
VSACVKQKRREVPLATRRFTFRNKKCAADHFLKLDFFAFADI